MQGVVKAAFFAAAVAAGAALPGPAQAASHDGSWSVVVITEKGDCDPAYRYAVKVADGRVTYSGDAGVDMNGTVSPNGAVKVSIRLGDKGANGTGHLSANAGRGTWQGASSNASCAGRWEAERQ